MNTYFHVVRAVPVVHRVEPRRLARLDDVLFGVMLFAAPVLATAAEWLV